MEEIGMFEDVVTGKVIVAVRYEGQLALTPAIVFESKEQFKQFLKQGSDFACISDSENKQVDLPAILRDFIDSLDSIDGLK